MLDTLFGLGLSLSLIAISLICGATAIYMAYKNIQAWRMATQSQSWSVAPGRVVKADLVWKGARTRHLQPQIQYTYEVNGMTYTGRRITFEFGHAYSRPAAEKFIQRYPVNQSASVYYDPAQPHESSLEQTHAGVVSGLLVSFILLLSPTSFCLWVGLIGLADTLNK